MWPNKDVINTIQKRWALHHFPACISQKAKRSFSLAKRGMALLESDLQCLIDVFFFSRTNAIFSHVSSK